MLKSENTLYHIITTLCFSYPSYAGLEERLLLALGSYSTFYLSKSFKKGKNELYSYLSKLQWLTWIHHMSSQNEVQFLGQNQFYMADI